MTMANKSPYQITRIIEYLSQPDNAIHFVRSANIAEITKIHEIHTYARSDDRRGLVLNSKETGIAGNSQIFIDVKHGPPSTDQLCEAIYGAGTISGNRILIYTGTSSEDNENPAANYGLIERLVRRYEYNDALYLVRALVPEIAGKPIIFMVNAQSEGESKASNNDQVSERNFREMEFWFAFMDSLEPELYKSWTPPKAENFLNLDYGHFTNVGPFQVRLGWNEFGAFVWVVQRDNGKNGLSDLWRTNQMKLNKLFNGAEVTLETPPGQSSLTLKISDRPLGWLIEATAAAATERLDFAQGLYAQYMAMVKFIRKEA